MKDGYTQFLKDFSISENEFIDFGLKEIITVEKEVAWDQWKELKDQIYTTRNLVLRNYGRKGEKNIFFEELYYHIFNIEKIHWDKTNNAAPKNLLKD